MKNGAMKTAKAILLTMVSLTILMVVLHLYFYQFRPILIRYVDEQIHKLDEQIHESGYIEHPTPH